MRLDIFEFIHRYLIHILPDGFHCIRHCGLLASSTRKANIARTRALLHVQRPDQVTVSETKAEITLRKPCPCGGGSMRIIEIFSPG